MYKALIEAKQLIMRLNSKVRVRKWEMYTLLRVYLRKKGRTKLCSKCMWIYNLIEEFGI